MGGVVGGAAVISSSLSGALVKSSSVSTDPLYLPLFSARKSTIEGRKKSLGQLPPSAILLGNGYALLLCSSVVRSNLVRSSQSASNYTFCTHTSAKKFNLKLID